MFYFNLVQLVLLSHINVLPPEYSTLERFVVFCSFCLLAILIIDLMLLVRAALPYFIKTTCIFCCLVYKTTVQVANIISARCFLF